MTATAAAFCVQQDALTDVRVLNRAEDMTTILLTPTPWPSAYPPPVYNDFWILAYSAIDD